jgi:hypothetical protein
MHDITEHQSSNERLPLFWPLLSGLCFLFAYVRSIGWFPNWVPTDEQWIYLGTLCLVFSVATFLRWRAARLRTDRARVQAVVVWHLIHGIMLLGGALAFVFVLSLTVLDLKADMFGIGPSTIAAVVGTVIIVSIGAVVFWLQRRDRAYDRPTILEAAELAMRLRFKPARCLRVSKPFKQGLQQHRRKETKDETVPSDEPHGGAHDWAVMLAYIAAGELMIPIIYMSGSRRPNPPSSAATRLLDAAQSAHFAIWPAMAVVFGSFAVLLLFSVLYFRFHVGGGS